MRSRHAIGNHKTLVVQCNRPKRQKQRYVYTKTNMELVVKAFEKELELLRKMCQQFNPPQPHVQPPPPPPRLPPHRPPPPPPPPTTEWKGRTRAPIGPPKINNEKPEEQIRRYKTYYDKYPSILENIPIITMRKVDKYIPKKNNGRPMAPINSNKFENVLKNAVRKYKNSKK